MTYFRYGVSRTRIEKLGEHIASYQGRSEYD